ncbi:hypothetical protein GLOIN_2v1479067 [Rhizophagus clarus]|uniref:Uncharacterized protein n=1 Tax=Rhizophagus clarus TaxID=94130 RepID=A0A8H3QFV0_9GLOM|nr:hypothetical protein GLOIN_2v1479067 [Rhizophagus clarus]
MEKSNYENSDNNEDQSRREINDNQLSHERIHKDLSIDEMIVDDNIISESPSTITYFQYVIQKSSWCLCCNYYACKCRPIIHSTYCFVCGNYKCRSNKNGYKRDGLHFFKNNRIVADPISEISGIKQSLERYRKYNVSKKVHCSWMEVRCQCKNENEIIIVYDYDLEEWCCKDCKYIIKSDWKPKDFFKCYCNFYEQKDSVFDYECQSKVWKCRDCQYDIKI